MRSRRGQASGCPPRRGTHLLSVCRRCATTTRRPRTRRRNACTCTHLTWPSSPVLVCTRHRHTASIRDTDGPCPTSQRPLPPLCFFFLFLFVSSHPLTYQSSSLAPHSMQSVSSGSRVHLFSGCSHLRNLLQRRSSWISASRVKRVEVGISPKKMPSCELSCGQAHESHFLPQR